MFRLISLNFDDQSYLGHMPADSLVFVPEKERTTTALPYSTVLIGPNGTGKSTILSYIAKIFEDINELKASGKRNSKAISFPYSISYQINERIFTITQLSGRLNRDAFRATSQVIKWVYHIHIDGVDKSGNWSIVETPSQVIAVSYLPMDRFRQKKNSPNDFYQYLGLRHRSNAASPQYFLNNTLPLLFNFISKNKSIQFLKDILKFMHVDPTYLGVQLEYRYKKQFFTGKLDKQDFINLFENSKSYSKREGTSFALGYFENYIRSDNNLIAKIVQYLNARSIQDSISVGEKSILEFDLFENIELIDELSLIHHLQKLDLLASASLIFRKAPGQSIKSQDLSSGEFHFLTTMIAILVTIEKNSLVLIDEPDTSLHPNWQMKYIHNLKSLFKHWNSSHFIMTTHSHFIVSDLESSSSEVIGIKGSAPRIKAKAFNVSTFGLSAEEVLLEIFEVPTTRNYYVYEKIGEILDVIANRDTDISKYVTDKGYVDVVKEKLGYLLDKGLDKLSQEDPLKEVIDKLLSSYGRS